MFSLRCPSDRALARLRARLAGSALTYEPIGLCAQTPPGYDVGHVRVPLGEGRATFERACALIDDWAMLPTWVTVVPHETPRVGLDVVVVARHIGCWSANGCRVVALTREDVRYGFSYGTLDGHAECGEERFLVEVTPDGGVWYEVRAVSRPGSFAAKAGAPVARRLQRRFREDSAAALSARLASP